MMNFKVLAFAAAFVGISGQDIDSWCPNIVTDAATCASTHLRGQTSLQSHSRSFLQVLSITTLMTDSLGEFCTGSTKTAMVGVYNCVLTKLAACVPSEWQAAATTKAQALGAIDFLCTNVANIDVACLTSARMSTMNTCFTSGSSALPKSYAVATLYKEYRCLAYPVLRACVESSFAPCTKNTASLLLEAGDKYQKIAACDGVFVKPSLVMSFPIFRACVQSTYAPCAKNTASLLLEAADKYEKIAACDGVFVKPSLVMLALSLVFVCLYKPE